MRAFIDDLRFAARSLRRDRGFTAATVSTLAVAIALFLASTAVTRAYLLRDLPYPSAERLHWVRYGGPAVPAPRGLETLDWGSLADLVEHPVAWDLDAFYLLGGERTETSTGAWVTPGFVAALGVRPALGRGLSPEAFREGGPNEALISHRLWQSRYGGSPDVVGRSFTAYVADRPQEAESFRIVGVLPASFWHLNPYTEIFAPLRGPTFPYMVRLRPGVAPETLRQRVTALVTAGAREVPAGWQASVEGVHEAYVAAIRPTLRATNLASLLVLAIGCANVAALLLVRGARRRHEVAVRTALGAGRRAICRLLAAEAVVLGLSAAALASLLAGLALEALGPALQDQIGRSAPGGVEALRLDAPLTALAAGVGVLAALACSLAPLVVALRPNLAAFVHGAARGATAGRGVGRFRAALLALQVAASLALLVGAGLMLRSAHGLGRVDLGIAPQGVVSGSLTLRASRYPEASSRAAVLEAMRSRLADTSGTSAIAFTSMWPLQQAAAQPVRAESGAETRAPAQLVSPGYFEALGIPLRAGRALDASDRHGAELVVVVSETLARRLWPAGDALGRVVSLPQPHSTQPPVPRRVVGVAADVKQGPLDDELADAYVPLLQEPGRFAFALLRHAAAPPQALDVLRDAVRSADPEIAVDRTVALAELADRASAGPRLLAGLLAGFALAAVMLALVGIAGAVAYAVRQREREIAVRVALGAAPAQVVRLFLKQGGTVLGAGLALGVPGALGVGRLLESQLFAVGPRDPLTLSVCCLLFAAAALCATWWPARRAAVTDPSVALRVE
jgi:predicted permease